MYRVTELILTYIYDKNETQKKARKKILAFFMHYKIIKVSKKIYILALVFLFYQQFSITYQEVP
jgi:hypothetical protein